MTKSRTSIFVTFGISNTHGKIRFHSMNQPADTAANLTRKDGRNSVRMITNAVGMSRAAGASWYLGACKDLTAVEKKFLRDLIAKGAPVTRVHGFGNGKFYQGQAVAAKRA